MECSENEAVEKWCPFVQVSTGSLMYVSNRIASGIKVKCLGRNCMAWVHTYQTDGRCGLIYREGGQ